MKDEKVYILTGEQLRDIYTSAAQIGAAEGVKAYEDRKKNEYNQRADRRLRNTKLLLRNYRMLKEHAEHSVFGRTQMEESAADILESMMSMYDNEVVIDSIKRSATRTAVILSHIDTMFSLYESLCHKASNPDVEIRRYSVIKDKFLAEEQLTMAELVDKYMVSRETVSSDIRLATEKLSALIFGVDGLKIR